MPEDELPLFAGSVARPTPGEAVPLAVVERIAEMLSAQWRQFGDRWDQFAEILKGIQAEVAALAKASHESPCNAMREHRDWHEEQSRELRAFRRQIFYIVLGAAITFALGMAAWALKG